MSNIYTGTTNTTGSGSSANLNETNATSYLSGSGTLDEDVYLEISSGFIYAAAQTWDQEGYKEVKIESDDDYVYVSNFVDVYIENTNYSSYIFAIDAKRGSIQTGEGSDVISVSVKSNSSLWDNTFTIDSGSGHDSVYLTNSLNSKYTSFDIDLGSGNDLLDISSLESPNDLSVTRFADGGTGVDKIIFSGDNTVSFENFEIIVGENEAALDIDSDFLSDNSTSSTGVVAIILSNIDIAIDDSISNIEEASSLDSDQIEYLVEKGFDPSSFIALNLTTDSWEYTVLTDDADYLAS